MASIYQRTNKDGKKVWRMVIRMKGHPTICDHFERKVEAEDEARKIEAQIKEGKYVTNKAKEKTLAELIDLYIPNAVHGYHKAAKDTVHQLNYFRGRLGSYSLIYITPDLLLQERKRLLELHTNRGDLRNPATVNRYFATLRGAFRYACNDLRWISENPCGNFIKLKAKPKTRRVLTEEEEIRLLQACRESMSPYLYCIVLVGLTTGARKSEILNLNWDAIDFDNRVAHIKDSKNGKPRRVGLVHSVIEELKRLYHLRDIAKPLVFASKTAFGKVDIKKSWHAALKKANIDNFVFHGLRHHFCSKGVNAITETYISIRELNPDFEQASAKEWRKKEARCWLHGGTELHETVELEQWLYYYPEGTKTAHSLASIHYCEWSEYIEEGGKDGDNKYLDFRPGDLIEPENEETLLVYIQRLSSQVEVTGWGSKKEKRALKSFLDYLRVYYKQEDIAFIEHIFPEKTDLHHGRVIRVIWPQSYPISQLVAADIIKELAYKCAYGRPNTQLNAAEALGLSWLCLIASRIRLPRTLEMVHGISSEDLLLNGEYPELLIPSIFGKQKIRISLRVARFLQTLVRVPSAIPRKTILQKSLRDLRSPLNNTISKASPPDALGEITFLTFLSTPHHFDEQIRYIPKVLQNQ